MYPVEMPIYQQFISFSGVFAADGIYRIGRDGTVFKLRVERREVA
jgi:hypothetical protein